MAHVTEELSDLAPDLARDDDLPLGAQLAWRLRVLIASGALSAGDRLPGVRELAAGSRVNVNTARAVYRRLEDEGAIVSRHGRGTFVRDDAPSTPELERLASDAVEMARGRGVDPRDLARAIYTGNGTRDAMPPATANRAAVDEAAAALPDATADERLGRQELRRQIARLEAQLASYPEARGSAETTHPLLLPKGHVAGMAELERTRDGLIERLRVAREAAEERGERERRARARLEEMAADPGSHKWETVSSDEIGEPGCGRWQVQPRLGPVGALMNWWRVKISSGCPLAGAA